MVSEEQKKTLHGIARLHVHLARMDGENISTRGWKYNDLINWSCSIGIGGFQAAQETIFDTLDGVCEIGPRAVYYISIWQD